MKSIEDIQKRSVSSNELVVCYMDAMDLIDIFRERGFKVLGWEGWLVYPNGAIGHSSRHQGTSDLSAMPATAASDLVKATITQAYKEWQLRPEVPNVELYFCITVDT